MIFRSVCSIGSWITSAGSFVSSIFATPTSPDSWLQYHRRIRDLATWAVIIGVIAEILIDEFWQIERPPLLRGLKATTPLKTRADRYKRYAMIFAGVVMVGGGIGVETWQGGQADKVADEIRHNLEIELIAVEARTHLLVANKDQIIDKLNPFPQQKIAIFLSPGDQEQMEEEIEFGVVIMGLVTHAGWLNPAGNKYSEEARELNIDDDAAPYFDNGLTVEIDDSATVRAKDAAEAFLSAIKSTHLRIGDATNMLLPRPSITPTDKDTILLFV